MLRSIEFDGHRPGIGSTSCEMRAMGAWNVCPGFARTVKATCLARLHFSQVGLWNWDNQTQMTAIDNLHKG